MLNLLNNKIIQYRKYNILKPLTVVKTSDIITNYSIKNSYNLSVPAFNTSSAATQQSSIFRSCYNLFNLQSTRAAALSPFGSRRLSRDNVGPTPLGVGVRTFHTTAIVNGKIIDFIKGIFQREDGIMYPGPVPNSNRKSNIKEWRKNVADRDELLNPFTSAHPPAEVLELRAQEAELRLKKAQEAELRKRNAEVTEAGPSNVTNTTNTANNNTNNTNNNNHTTGPAGETVINNNDDNFFSSDDGGGE